MPSAFVAVAVLEAHRYRGEWSCTTALVARLGTRQKLQLATYSSYVSYLVNTSGHVTQRADNLTYSLPVTTACKGEAANECGLHAS